MPIEGFTFEDITRIYPRVVANINRQIRHASNDCADRSSDPNPRKINIQLTLTPDEQPDGTCNSANMTVDVKTTVPPHKSATINLGLRSDGLLLVNLDSLDDINQATLAYQDDH